MNFSQRITDLLVETKHNQAELARFVGVKANTVSDWINKGTSPKIEHLYRIADFFSISFDYLFTGKSNSLSTNESELLEVFQNFNDREQVKIIGRIEEWLEVKHQREAISKSQRIVGVQVARRTDGRFVKKPLTAEEFERIDALPEDTDY